MYRRNWIGTQALAIISATKSATADERRLRLLGLYQAARHGWALGPMQRLLQVYTG
jgi:hypothetical protein